MGEVSVMRNVFIMLGVMYVVLLPITLPLTIGMFIKAKFFSDKIHDNDK
jgi:uncharacterized protein YneF (UPF0154 family)